jgi:hypothetical protein
LEEKLFKGSNETKMTSIQNLLVILLIIPFISLNAKSKANKYISNLAKRVYTDLDCKVKDVRP